MSRVTISTVDQFRRALNAGETWLAIDQPLYFNEPIEIRGDGPSFLTIEAGGGYSAPFYRMYDGGPPILTFGPPRQWELRWTGVTYDGRCLRGAGIDIWYAQLSRFIDLAIRNGGGDDEKNPDPPFLIRHSNACLFEGLQLYLNRAPIELRETSDFHINGKLSQTNWGAGGVQRESGIRITGPEHKPPGVVAGPGLIENLHLEGGRLEVVGVHRLDYRRGYHNATELDIRDCPEFVHDGMRGYFMNSSLLIDGAAVGPAIMQPA